MKTFSRLKCDTFTTTNDTSFWVLTVDGYLGLFNGAQAAKNALSSIGGMNWDDTGYGCCQIIPPNTVAMGLDDDFKETIEKTTCLVSDVQPIDIEGYVKKHSDRRYARHELDDILEGALASGVTPISKKFASRMLNKYIDKHDLNWFNSFGIEARLDKLVCTITNDGIPVDE